MGQVESNEWCGIERHNDAAWFVLASGRGDPAYHAGIGIGPDDDTGAALYLGLLSASLVSESAFGAAVVALPTLSGGPFPGVVPATWWSGLSATAKAKAREAARLKARRVG